MSVDIYVQYSLEFEEGLASQKQGPITAKSLTPVPVSSKCGGKWLQKMHYTIFREALEAIEIPEGTAHICQHS